MKEFLSLREFILLPDSFRDDISFHRHLNEPLEIPPWSVGPDIILRYELAKAAFEKYGEAPPVGSEIVTLLSGHGGGNRKLRIFGGVYQNDDRCFYLTRIEGGKEAVSLISRKQWWAEICPVNIWNEVVDRFQREIYQDSVEKLSKWRRGLVE